MERNLDLDLGDDIIVLNRYRRRILGGGGRGGRVRSAKPVSVGTYSYSSRPCKMAKITSRPVSLTAASHYRTSDVTTLPTSYFVD